MAVQGLSAIPTIFSDFIHRALHTDVNGDIDPIAFLVGYLDDVITFSPNSTLGYDFVEKMKEKCRNLASLCHVCYVSNPSTHRNPRSTPS